MGFVVEIITIGGSLPGFLRASCSGSAFAAPVVSMSISVVLRGVKKLRGSIAFGGSLTAVDVGTGLVNFLALYEVSLEIWLLHLFTSRKLSSQAIHSTEIWFTAPLCPACAFILRMAFGSV
jgi:hypothetical protein